MSRISLITRATVSQIRELEDGTEYHVRVAAYNGKNETGTLLGASTDFTAYGVPAEATPFPVMTREQVWPLA